MNGIHDMGGMQDMGPIEYVKTEPVFHAAWEARVYAMSSAVGQTGKLRLGLRPPIESIPPAEYLRMSYYEKWFTALIERMVASNLITRAEIEAEKWLWQSRRRMQWRDCSRFRRLGETSMSRRVSNPARRCAPAISIP